jgi:outer membrane protein OmpA-like peptidoglycan-associated protein
MTLHFGVARRRPVTVLKPAPVKEPEADLSDILGEGPDFSSGTAKSAIHPETGALTISPAYVSLAPDQSQQFKTHTIGTPDGRVLWSLMPDLGELSQSGIYQAPAEVLFPQEVWITARSEANPMHYERAVAHLEPSAEGPVTFRLNVAWDTGQSHIRPRYDSAIEKLARILRQYPQVTAVIKGYGDDKGSAQDHQRLSEERAQAVVAQLVSRFDIDPHRVAAQKLGASHARISDPTAEDRRINRCVEAVLTAPDVPAGDEEDF